MKDIKIIWYEGKLRKVSEVEHDHIHLDDGTVIRNNEIQKLPFGMHKSKWSEKKQLKNIHKKFSY